MTEFTDAVNRMTTAAERSNPRDLRDPRMESYLYLVSFTPDHDEPRMEAEAVAAGLLYRVRRSWPGGEGPRLRLTLKGRQLLREAGLL